MFFGLILKLCCVRCANAHTGLYLSQCHVLLCNKVRFTAVVAVHVVPEMVAMLLTICS